jgi:hypothetical protein
MKFRNLIEKKKNLKIIIKSIWFLRKINFLFSFYQQEILTNVFLIYSQFPLFIIFNQLNFLNKLVAYFFFFFFV